MHEMSIAEGVLDIALDYAKKNNATVIRKIGLKLGEMTGVVIDSLRFSFDMIAKGTMAEGAKLTVHQTPLMGRCVKCGKEFHIEGYDFWCPACENGVLEMISGREMQVEFLEVD